jgi:serine/threonine protein kinase
LLGELPFKGSSAEEIRNSNAACLINLEEPRHAPLLPEMKALLKGMLEADPLLRLTATQVAEHPFLSPQ